MAKAGFDETDPNQPATINIPIQKARQGQNVKGMIGVLVIGIVLVVAAFAIMLALQAEPVTPGNRAVEDTAPTVGPGGPAPVTPETAQSPT